MPFFKVDKIMQYTETVYIESDDSMQANKEAGTQEGFVNHDDTWIDSKCSKISKEEYEQETE